MAVGVFSWLDLVLSINAEEKPISVYGSSIAADETEDSVFLAAGSNIIHVLTCSLARKKGLRNIKAHLTVMSVEIIPMLK